MKELSIEEKAKRYDEAIERAKNYHSPETLCNVRIAMENLFPELKESESDDEKIRKELLDFCKNRAENYPNDPKYKNISAWIAWLEKQGESIDVDFILNKVGVKCAYKDGNAWCILYGDNIQDGVCGFGYTKEEALIEFLKELLEKQGE